MRSTPEQIRGFRIAGLVIDTGIAVTLALLAGHLLGWLAGKTGSFSPIAVRGAWILIWSLFLGAFLGRDALPGGSPGRRIVGLRVVGPDGKEIGFGRSVRRNLPLLVPFLNLYEERRLRLDPEQRRLGDRWAGTRVEEA